MKEAFKKKVDEIKISSKGKTFKILLFIDDSVWVAIVVFAINSIVDTKYIQEQTKEVAYEKAVEWFLNNVDAYAKIETK